VITSEPDGMLDSLIRNENNSSEVNNQQSNMIICNDSTYLTNTTELIKIALGG